MQRLALVRDMYVRRCAGAEHLVVSEDSNGVEVPHPRPRIARKGGSIIQGTREEIELYLASSLLYAAGFAPGIFSYFNKPRCEKKFHNTIES